MPYEEPTIIDEQGITSTLPGAEYMPDMDMSPYRSNENAFIKHLTERHIPKELGSEHKDRWLHRTMYSGKERSTSFFDHPQSLQYITISRANLDLIEILNEEELKWQHVYDMIDFSVTSHGIRGNMIKAVTIKRQEFEDKSQRAQQESLIQKASNAFRKQQTPEQQYIQE